MRNVTTLLQAAAFSSLLLLPATPSRAEANYGQIAMYVAYMLQNHHYSHHQFDDEISKKVLDSYLNLLDFSHIYFTQQDVDKFKAAYETTLDDHVLTRNISPAIEIYGIYEQRVKERVAYAKKLLETNKFTYDSNRTITVKREKAPWPKDKAAADALWSDLIESDMLAEVLFDINQEQTRKEKEKAAAEKKANPDAPPPVPAPETKPDPDAKAPEAKPEPQAEATPKVAPAADGQEKAVAKKDKDAPEPPNKRVLKRYERLLEQLNENETEDIVNYFLSCVATSYDPHTEYMSPRETDDFRIQMNHSLVGIGALLSSKDNVAEIQGIVVGGPADKQGELKLNDQIIAVAQGEKGEWVDIKYMKLQKIVEMIRGTSGTTVRLKINPAADPTSVKEIAIVRGEVELKEKLANAEMIVTPPVNGKTSRLGWITLPSFYADMDNGTVSCSADVERLLRRLMAEKIEGLVIDLRGDGGGSLEEAIKLTGLFIPKGPVVQAKDWKDNITWRDCENEKPVYSGPLIVITDKASASASEIFAAALQDYNRAVVVGEKSTFGKGTVQTILAVDRYMPIFSNKSRAGSLKVTIQKFYRIAGGSTQLKGVIPDIILPSVRDVMDIGEISLPNHLPYDTIAPRSYSMFSKTPLPLEDLRTRVQSRISTNPEFQYIQDDAERLKQRLDKNSLSLNQAERLKELDDSKARTEKRKEERKQRLLELAEKSKDVFEGYRLTLDNVDAKDLIKESNFTKEQASGMRLAKNNEDSESGADNSIYPFGIEPVKLETLNILRDMIQVQSTPTQTANTGEPIKGPGQ